MKAYGHAFERRVQRIFESCGYLSIRSNQWKTNFDFNKDEAEQREYDLVMFSLKERQFYIIECKSHFSSENVVGPEEVREFNSKLLNYSRGAKKVLVTDTKFTPAALTLARQYTIETVDGHELNQMERSGSTILRSVLSTISISLEDVLWY